MNFGERLKKLRNGAGETQEVLSNKLHVSRQTISNWENERSYPDIDMLIQLSYHYNISLDRLLKEDVMMENKVIDDGKKKRRYKRIIYTVSLLAFIFIVINLIWLAKIWSQNKYLTNNWESQEISQEYPDGLQGPETTAFYEKRQGNSYLSIPKESYSSQFRNNYLHFFDKTMITGAYVNESKEDLDIINVIYVNKDTFLVYIPLENFMEEPLVLVDQDMTVSTKIPQIPIDLATSQLIDEALVTEANAFLSKNRDKLLEVKQVAEKEFEQIN